MKNQQPKNKKQNRPIIKSEQVVKNDLAATMVAVLSGFIFALPWMLFYVYKTVTFGFLAILIPIGFYFSYKLFKGKYHKYLMLMMSIVSIIIVITGNLILIPSILFRVEGNQVNLNLLSLLYKYPAFKDLIIKDTIIALLFTISGIIIVYIFNKVKNKKNQK